MATYAQIIDDVYDQFADVTWTGHNIAAFPADYNGTKPTTQYVTISLVLSSSRVIYGGGKGPQSGALVCEIYTKSGTGQKGTALIADHLDTLLENKRLTDSGLEFQTSFIGTSATDTANAALSRAIYTLPFKTYGDQ